MDLWYSSSLPSSIILTSSVNLFSVLFFIPFALCQTYINQEITKTHLCSLYFICMSPFLLSNYLNNVHKIQIGFKLITAQLIKISQYFRYHRIQLLLGNVPHAKGFCFDNNEKFCFFLIGKTIEIIVLRKL